MKTIQRLVRITISLLVFTAAHQLWAAEEKGLYITPDMQYEYAQKCFGDKDYSTALVEFKRFAHFFPGDPRARQAKFLTGKALYHLKDYNAAKQVFDTFLYPFSEEPLVVEAYFMLGSTYGKMGKSGRAETVLQNLLLLTDDTKTKDRIHATLGWTHLKRTLEMDPTALKTAETNIDRLTPSGAQTYGKKRLKETITTIKQEKGKSPKIAGAAAVIPGMGFLYCERYRDAAISFLLNAALIMAAHESFDEGHEALGGVISFVEAGFYTGNIYGAISSAHKYNRNLRQQTLQSLEQDLKHPATLPLFTLPF
ncbi:MAG: outer membrane protein assembly factor BamD [Desulfobacteraceae bacterium]|nr:outer membrane protein assembly factor BamD [Desulfobacteraceae bacterium]